MKERGRGIMRFGSLEAVSAAVIPSIRMGGGGSIIRISSIRMKEQRSET